MVKYRKRKVYKFKPTATMREGFTGETWWDGDLFVLAKLKNGMLRIMNIYGHTLVAHPDELEQVA